MDIPPTNVFSMQRSTKEFETQKITKTKESIKRNINIITKKQTGSLKNIEHNDDYVSFDELYNNYYDYSINSIEYTDDESKNNIETMDNHVIIHNNNFILNYN